MSDKKSIDFRDLAKITAIQDSPAWTTARSCFAGASNIYLCGNGGSLSTALHGASDILRLTNKTAHAPESPVLISALANDHGYEDVFVNWLQLLCRHSRDTSGHMLIAFSSSGRSENINRVLRWTDSHQIASLLVSGRVPPREIGGSTVVVPLNVTSYHSHEILSMMLVYDLIESSGFDCPRIAD